MTKTSSKKSLSKKSNLDLEHAMRASRYGSSEKKQKPSSTNKQNKETKVKVYVPFSGPALISNSLRGSQTRNNSVTKSSTS